MTSHRASPLILVTLLATAAATFLTGCSSTAIAVKEKFGIAKREQLVDRVEDARDQQQQAKKQFESALAEFMSVTGQDGKLGELESKYKKLKSEYEDAESEAKDVKSSITDVERVGEAMFKEWQNDLNQFSNESYRRESERLLNDSRRQYDKLVAVMKTAATKMDPVLSTFKDSVLFLKHNLNAQAIAGLQGTATSLQNDINRLIADMEKSINEANTFITQMQQNK